MMHQGNVDQGMRVVSYLISGLLLYGGLGYLLDMWLATEWLLPTGIIFGALSGMFLVIRRYGR